MSKLGCHWIRTHPDGRDLSHIERMQYKSVKLFEWHWSDRNACNDLLRVLPQDAYILARDHPMSEQKGDMFADPVGTGQRHANEWADKVRSGGVHLPTNRTFFLGINEPDATTGDRHAIDKYTSAFLDRLREHGLRGGAFNFSTGHPRTVDGTGSTPADYSVFEQSHQSIVRGQHLGVLHIYGTAAVPCAPGHFDRLKACPWQDVEWVVGEMGADEHVVGGGKHDGYLISMHDNPARYCQWLDTLIMGIADPRIHSYQVFTYDYSHPWSSFDVREIRDALESYDWQHVKQVSQPPKPPPQSFTTAYVQVPSGARLRKAPVHGDIITAVPYGEPVKVLEFDADGGWHIVQYGDVSGWMLGSLLSLEPVQPLQEPTPAPQPTQPSGDNWQRSIAYVRRWEGGWADNANDPGGATNKGITIGTYTRWRETHGQPKPTKDDLRNLSDAEANEIFREWYWLASGADKLPWPLCLAHFDTAVNAGPARAQEMLAKSGGIFLRYMGHLIDFYTRIPNFEHFGRAWIRRRADLLLEASR